MSVRQIFITSSIIVVPLIYATSIIWPFILWSYLLVIPLVLIGTIDVLQKKQAIRRLYPIIGRLRYMFESIRPEIQQYFVESDTNGTPVSREFRSLIYQRAKGARDTRPFEQYLILIVMVTNG